MGFFLTNYGKAHFLGKSFLEEHSYFSKQKIAGGDNLGFGIFCVFPNHNQIVAEPHCGFKYFRAIESAMCWNKLLTSKLSKKINDRYLLLKKLAQICVYKKIAGPVILGRYKYNRPTLPIPKHNIYRRGPRLVLCGAIY